MIYSLSCVCGIVPLKVIMRNDTVHPRHVIGYETMWEEGIQNHNQHQ